MPPKKTLMLELFDDFESYLGSMVVLILSFAFVFFHLGIIPMVLVLATKTILAVCNVKLVLKHQSRVNQSFEKLP